jgi:hypothetical protein
MKELTNDERLGQQSERGIQAQQLLNNPLFAEALTMMRGELMTLFEQTKFKEKDERDEIWRKLQIVGWFESYITKVMQTGQLADKTLKDKVKSILMR